MQRNQSLLFESVQTTGINPEQGNYLGIACGSHDKINKRGILRRHGQLKRLCQYFLRYCGAAPACTQFNLPAISRIGCKLLDVGTIGQCLDDPFSFLGHFSARRLLDHRGFYLFTNISQFPDLGRVVLVQAQYHKPVLAEFNDIAVMSLLEHFLRKRGSQQCGIRE